MSDGAEARSPTQDMAVDEDKKGNSGEEPIPQHLRQNAMDEAPLFSEFSGSGRTGRRNALPNIMQESVAAIGTSAITEMLDQLSCAGGNSGGGTAGGGAGGANGGPGGGMEVTRPEEQLGACGGVGANPNQR